MAADFSCCGAERIPVSPNSPELRWHSVFVIAVALNATAALLALLGIKPLRRAFIDGNEAIAVGSSRTGEAGTARSLRSGYLAYRIQD